jgi:hypothetical protein
VENPDPAHFSRDGARGVTKLVLQCGRRLVKISRPAVSREGDPEVTNSSATLTRSVHSSPVRSKRQSRLVMNRWRRRPFVELRRNPIEADKTLERRDGSLKTKKMWLLRTRRRPTAAHCFRRSGRTGSRRREKR